MAQGTLPGTGRNTIYCGDCFTVLQDHIPTESVDLVYVDPPFGSGEEYEVVYKDGVEIRHFKDRWVGGKEGYLKWIGPRIQEIHRVLKPTGSFYLHCDDHLDGYLRVKCDEVFGDGNFRNEIIWRRTTGHTSRLRWPRIHDTILMYVKESSATPKFHPKKVAPDPGWMEREYKRKGGKSYADLTAEATRNGPSGKPWRGIDPAKVGKGRHWRYVPEMLDKLDAEGKIYWPKHGKYPKLIQDRSEGSTVGDLWIDREVQVLGRTAGERMNWPTQKPVRLLERIIEASTDAGDVVLDPMCGCGTTIEAAAKLDREWVGIDISPTSCRLMAERMTLPVNSIVGLPRSVVEVKEMVKLDPIEFQNWVCDILHAVSTTRRGLKPHADANVDGWILSTIPVQIKGSEGVGYAEIERFVTTLRKRGKAEGYFVGFSFSKPAYEEALRAAREDKLSIDLLEVTEKVVPAEGGKPEVTTYLRSELTKRTWGETTEAGPSAPVPFMVRVKEPKGGQTKLPSGLGQPSDKRGGGGK